MKLNTISIPHWLFCIIYTLSSTLIYNIGVFITLFNDTDATSLGGMELFFLTLIIYHCILYIIYSLLFHKYTTKIFAVLFTIGSAVCNYFTSSYGIGIDSQMVTNAFVTDANEVRELLSIHTFVYVVVYVVIPVYIIFFTKIRYQGIIKHLTWKVASVAMAIVLTATLAYSIYMPFTTFWRENSTRYGHLLTPINYIGAVAELINENNLSKTSTLPKHLILKSSQHTNNNVNIVLIIGETARRVNFSLYGYPRNTNPMLGKIHNLQVLQNATSCGTSTVVSVPCVFRTKQGYENLISALSSIGVNISWYENNYGGCYGLCDKIKHFNSVHPKCDDNSCYDEVIFNKFADDFKITRTSGQNLFVLHMNGSHGPMYYKRYPKKFAIFQPACTLKRIEKCPKDQFINAYDNTIVYTDHLLYSLIQSVKASGKNTVVIYASDHGESLGEKGIFLHGFPYSIAPKEQKEIPFLIWQSNGNRYKVPKKSSYSHADIAPMILNILNLTDESKP